MFNNRIETLENRLAFANLKAEQAQIDLEWARTHADNMSRDLMSVTREKGRLQKEANGLIASWEVTTIRYGDEDGVRVETDRITRTFEHEPDAVHYVGFQRVFEDDSSTVLFTKVQTKSTSLNSKGEPLVQYKDVYGEIGTSLLSYHPDDTPSGFFTTPA